MAQNDEKGEHVKKDNNASDGWEDIERVKENKLKAVFICSGERDAMCVRSLGYQPIWFNSETHDISHEEMNTILKYAETVYNTDKVGITALFYTFMKVVI